MSRYVKAICLSTTLLVWPFFAMAQNTTMPEGAPEMNKSYNAFLAKYIVQKDGINLVQYGKVTAEDERSLEDYIETLSDTDITSYTDQEVLAYWFNLYNAKTLDLILDNYPVKSIKKIGFLSGPWDKDILNVRGQEMSLNNIEHDTVRETFNEPRVHFAFNCASIGCPNLKATAWEASTLDADLTQATKNYIASPRGVRIEKDGEIAASKIFKWYNEDFGENETDVIAFLAKFAEGDKKAALQKATEIDDYDYDWSLNVAN